MAETKILHKIGEFWLEEDSEGNLSPVTFATPEQTSKLLKKLEKATHAETPE